jgi:hypothetical protein
VTLPRGEGAELRVSLAEYQGRPYVSLRVWERGSDGELWPSKKGCSIRASEIGPNPTLTLVANSIFLPAL